MQVLSSLGWWPPPLHLRRLQPGVPSLTEIFKSEAHLTRLRPMNGGYGAPQWTKLPSVTKYGKKEHGHPIRVI